MNDTIVTILICLALAIISAVLIIASLIRLSRDEKSLEDLEQEEYLQNWELMHHQDINRRKK